MFAKPFVGKNKVTRYHSQSMSRRHHRNEHDSKVVVEVDDWLTSTRACLLDSNTMLLDEGGRRQCADYHDTPSAMTSGRLVARFLSRFSWYYPTNETDHSARGVSLDRAWAYYEHVTLGRIYADDEQPHNQQQQPPQSRSMGSPSSLRHGERKYGE